MELVHKLNRWANARTNILFDLLRILLGTFLFYKGVQFTTSSEVLVGLIAPNISEMGAVFIVHYVAMAHLTGGLFIVLGMLTRIALAVQLPILLGAVIINFTGEWNLDNFFQASGALVFAVFFLIYGSGKHSIDYKMKLNM